MDIIIVKVFENILELNITEFAATLPLKRLCFLKMLFGEATMTNPLFCIQ